MPAGECRRWRKIQGFFERLHEAVELKRTPDETDGGRHEVFAFLRRVMK